MNRRIRRLQARDLLLNYLWGKACLAYHAAPPADQFDRMQDVERIERQSIGNKGLLNYLLIQHKARIARALHAPSYDGVPRLANNSDRHLCTPAQCNSVLRCTRSFSSDDPGRLTCARRFIRFNLTLSR